MLDLQRYAFYDAKRTMRLTLEPVSILEMLQDLPGELLFSAPLPAARLGVPCASPDVMHARAAEFAQFDEETAFRLWFNPEPSADGRSVYVSAPDALPEMNGAPDFSIASAGFLIGSTFEMLQWVQSLTAAQTPDEQRSELSKMLSAACEPPHAAILTELSSSTELMRWPVQCGNPIRALSQAAAQWPEVKFAEDDFEFTLKPDLIHDLG